MNTLEQTNDIINEIELARKKEDGTFSILLHDGKRIENVVYQKLSVNEENPETATAFLEYTTEDTHELAIVNIFEIKAVF